MNKLYHKYTKLFLLIFILPIMACTQEDLMFFPEKLPASYEFEFDSLFEEMTFEVGKNISINGLLFPAHSSKGLIFYLHGNAGSLRTWAEIAPEYTANNYDFFILDYRGFGKSGGTIKSEKDFYNDIQIVYDSLKTRYDEENIIIIGYSIGTGSAAYLASTNNPKHLILKAPFYNMVDLVQQHYKFIPSFIVKYKFKTNSYIPNIICPVTIFHGDKDEVINIDSSYKLKMLFKPTDQLIVLKGQPHNGINENYTYQKNLTRILINK